MPVALLSVYDKSGVASLAHGLTECGWEIWSSGGTARVLREAGIDVVDVAEITGFPPMLGHRVATLHPLIHGGILADRNDPQHLREMHEYGIRPIDMVVVGLYPFAAEPGTDMIDIGGPALVRAAAKNHEHVAVVVRPQDYDLVLGEVRASGEVSASTRRVLAHRAFTSTAEYDEAVVRWLSADGVAGEDDLPGELVLSARRVQRLRYGENPHQIGARYRIDGISSWWDDSVQHQGKELSYLNVFDTDAAWALVHRFADPACVIVKHANPCGVSVVPGGSISDCYRRAHNCDPVSAFGGIVAFNRRVPADVATALSDVFTEVVVAPSFDDDALSILSGKPNLRVISGPPPRGGDLDVRSIDGGLLVQTPDRVSIDVTNWKVVTKVRPTPAQWADIAIAWNVVAAVSSNSIVLVHDGDAVGIGGGQQNRLDAARIAVERAAGRATGGVCASDAFFPFRDGIDAVASAGIAVVVQPGGSIRDDEAIAAADELGLAMVFTGERHFRH